MDLFRGLEMPTVLINVFITPSLNKITFDRTKRRPCINRAYEIHIDSWSIFCQFFYIVNWFKDKKLPIHFNDKKLYLLKPVYSQYKFIVYIN